MMKNSPYTDLFEAYYFGTLQRESKQRLKEELANNEQLAAEYRAFQLIMRTIIMSNPDDSEEVLELEPNELPTVDPGRAAIIAERLEKAKYTYEELRPETKNTTATESPAAVVRPLHRKSVRSWWAAAAAVLLLGVVGWWFLKEPAQPSWAAVYASQDSDWQSSLDALTQTQGALATSESMWDAPTWKESLAAYRTGDYDLAERRVRNFFRSDCSACAESVVGRIYLAQTLLGQSDATDTELDEALSLLEKLRTESGGTAYEDLVVWNLSLAYLRREDTREAGLELLRNLSRSNSRFNDPAAQLLNERPWAQ